MEFFQVTCILVAAYLLGSIPVAVIISRRFAHADIRTVGDGNMGARNTFRTLGPKYGFTVALIDILKGALPVLLASAIGLSLGWQMAIGIAAILGHDFPVFARFRGGQGLATAFGTLLALSYLPALVGLATYGAVFLMVRKSPVSAGVGGAALALAVGISGQLLLLAYVVGVLVLVPVKQLIDSPRRRMIVSAKEK
jgi:acyl phosphate:glycerol-3-phosphate acyltransferase